MRRVVIKLYYSDGDLAWRRRLESEARRLACLEGPRVAQVLDVVASGDSAALIIRYVPGCSLADLLDEQKTLPPDSAIAILTDLAAALASARQQLVVHGDIKADNVLIGRDGRAVLADFGIAVTTGRQAYGASEAALTPEHCRGALLTQQSDFFALGILTHRMLCGTHPFACGGRIDRQRVLQGFTGSAPLADSLSPALAQKLSSMMLWLMARRPEDRPQNTASLRNELRALRSELPPAPALSDIVTRLARNEQEDAAVPALPDRLRNLPRRERWWAGVKTYWQYSTIGAQATIVASIATLAVIAVMYSQQPGPCVEVKPVALSLSPYTEPRLPSAAVLEQRMLSNIRSWVSGAQVLGELAGSDSQPRLRPQGMRDICVAERQMQLTLRCIEETCRMELLATGPQFRRHTETQFSVDSGLAGVQQGIDQLMKGQMDALLGP
jgi:serine/threonine protein kinase